MPSLPIWLAAIVIFGTALGVVVAHFEFMWVRTGSQGSVAAAVAAVAVGIVIAGADRWPVVLPIGFFLIPAATAFAVGVFRAQRLRQQL